MSESKNFDGFKYWTYGNENSPVLILIHGFRGTHHGLELIARNLNDDFYIIIPDLPGFGESKKLPNEHSIQNYSTWLKDFIDFLNLKTKPNLVGHSFGSIVTSYFASQFPSCIDKLILINPIGYPALKGPKIILSELSAFYYWIGKILPKPAAEKWLSSTIVTQIMSSTMAKTKNNELRKYIHSQHHEHFSSFADKYSVSEAFQASIRNNVRDCANQIRNNTLIIIGSRDDITPVSRQIELSKMFTSADLKEIKNVGHLTHYEKPAEVAGLIRKFLK